MSKTLRNEESEPRGPRQRPVLIHVLNYDDLLAAPLGMRPLGSSLTLGRKEEQDPEAGLWLNDRRVSVRHLTLETSGGKTVATDLGSSNGTLLNGRRMQGPEPLADGDLLEVGHSLFCFRKLAADAPVNGWTWGTGRTFCLELGELGAQLDRIAKSSEPVLILGQTGAGKEIAARRVHQVSGRSGPLVSIDCGAIPEALVESTLFGHEKGAFTGATEPRVGDIARAHRGTLLLDEVGNLPLATQAKLLRVLETRAVRPVGGLHPVEVDVRWVAATNAELGDEDSFRSDLRFRLAGFVARLPPLKKRREDLGLLIAALLKETGVAKASITRNAARRLVQHSFPGNVRQLRQLLRSAAFLATSGKLEVDDDVIENIAPTDEAAPLPSEPETPNISPPRMAQPPRAVLEESLRTAQGRISAAAQLLNTSPRQLYRWLERLGIDADSFRPEP
jgi:sigma-54 dependent transcriptional regulator, acetoin dehydrogenase operon transcriptional activator AcoR